MKQEERMSGDKILKELNESTPVINGTIIDLRYPEDFTWSLGRYSLLEEVEVEAHEAD